MIPGPDSGEHPDELLSALLDGELDAETQAAVNRHVDICRLCHQELVEIEQARAALRALPTVPAPDGLVTNLVARRRRASRRGLALSLAAAAVAAVIGLVSADPAVESDKPLSGDVPRRDDADEHLSFRQETEGEHADPSLTERAEHAARELLDFLAG